VFTFRSYRVFIRSNIWVTSWCFARGSLLGGCRIGLTLPVLMRCCTMLVLPVGSSAVAKASLSVRIKALTFLICSSVRRFQPSRKSSSTLVSLAFPLLCLGGSSSHRTTRSTGWYRPICKPFLLHQSRQLKDVTRFLHFRSAAFDS
jgi:hypothetical protein